MATPFLAGLAVAAAALAGRYGIQAWNTMKTRPPKVRTRRFYEGGFQPTMTRREAALILGIRWYGGSISLGTGEEKVRLIRFLVQDLTSHKHQWTNREPENIGISESIKQENAGADKVREAHRRVMVANHPDAGGSHYLASKINEAKDVMLGKSKSSGSAF